MAGFGPWELLIILGILLLVFGVGRIAKIGGELGQGVSAFRKGLKEGNEEEAEEKEPTD